MTRYYPENHITTPMTNEELADDLLKLDGPSELFVTIAARLRAQDQKKDGRDVEFWHGSYHLLRESILKHLDCYIIDDDVAEEAILCEAIERAGAQNGERCYTCGAMGVTLNSVPLQEDGPRRVLVCGSCMGKINSGEIKRNDNGPTKPANPLFAQNRERIEGWAANGPLWEFAEDTESFRAGLTSRRATLILHPEEPESHDT